MYQYNRDSRTRDYEYVPDDTPAPQTGEKISREVGSHNLEWLVENVTTIQRTIAATADRPEEQETRFIIDLSASSQTT